MLGTNGNAVVSGDLSLCDNNIILKTNYDVGTAITSAEMSIDGKIGIGTSNPQHELTVQGTIYTSESSVVTSSDSRIKTDISLVNDDTALNQVNKLESYQYNYTDPLRKKEMKTIGFIAQEVKEVIPNAVSTLIQTIPDEMRIIDNAEWVEFDNKWYMTIPDLDLSDNHTGRCRFYVKNESMTNELKLELEVQENKKTFILNNKWDNIFFYGKEINDFHTLDKNQIFALHHSAIQELDRKHEREVKAKDEKIKSLETRMAALEALVLSMNK